MNDSKKSKKQLIEELEELRHHLDELKRESTDQSESDITELKKIEVALIESENKYRTLFERSADAILIVEGDKFVDCNAATVEMLGYNNKEELLQTHPSQLSPEKQPDGKSSFTKANEILSTAFDQGSQRFEWDHIRQNGEVFPVEVLLTPVPFGEKIFLHVVWRDITERKRLEELESRAARLDTAGTIAGQVAHDFNNLLAPLMAYPEFIREKLPRNHTAHKYLNQIEETSQKMADINQQLLTLGRRGQFNQEALNLNKIVSKAVEEIAPLVDNVTCAMDLDSSLMNVLGGSSQIHRAISNLLYNAIDALRGNGNGHIYIRTENYYADDVIGTYNRIPKGEYCKLTISDTGCGISDDIVQKIFDPFFSTKTTDQRRGSGLGLSVVDAVIKDHNAFLDLETKSDKGTSFYLYFPTTRRLLDEDQAEENCRGNETILIVDDDDIQRDVSTQLLERLGYEVNSVKSGEKAIEYLKEKSQDLIILDMVMPDGIDGAETYRQILDINPAQKAIIFSGFSESERVFEVQKLGAGAFVKKPVTKKIIAAAVRAELDKKVKIKVS